MSHQLESVLTGNPHDKMLVRCGQSDKACSDVKFNPLIVLFSCL